MKKKSRIALSLVVCILALNFYSCQEETLDEQEEPVNIENQDVSDVIAKEVDITFHYKGNNFSQTEWDEYVKETKYKFYYVGLNADAYVFDSELEAKQFEDVDLQILFKEMDEAKAKEESFQKAGAIQSVHLRWMVRVFVDRNYSNGGYTWYTNEWLDLQQNSLGFKFNSPTKHAYNLTSQYKNTISSYKIDYLKFGNFSFTRSDGSTYAGSLKMRVSLEDYDDTRRSIDKTLNSNNTYYSDADLADNRMGITRKKWNDRIDRFTIQFIR